MVRQWKNAAIVLPLVMVGHQGCAGNATDEPLQGTESVPLSEKSVALRQSSEDVDVAEVSGGAETPKISIHRHLRAIRQAFEQSIVPGVNVPGAMVKVDRFCGGVALSPNVTLTAGSCVSLVNHNMDVIVDFFSHQTPEKNMDMLPFKAEFQFTVFYASQLERYIVPERFPSATRVDEGVAKNSVVASHVNAWPKADVGFVYTWGTFASGRISADYGKVNVGSPVSVCTNVPTVGDKIIVTGLKVGPKGDRTTDLSWVHYPARITRVLDAESEVYQPKEVGVAAAETKSMMFLSEPINQADCALGGDAGGGVFLEKPESQYCLLAINSAQGKEISSSQIGRSCKPTSHRRVTSKMLSNIPTEPINQSNTYNGKTIFVVSEATSKKKFGVPGIDKVLNEFTFPIVEDAIVKTGVTPEVMVPITPLRQTPGETELVSGESEPISADGELVNDTNVVQ